MDTFLSSNHNKKPNQLEKAFGGLNNLPDSATMDPVSILSTIGTVGVVANGACALAFQLYTFVKDIKNVDQAVDDLASEVKNLDSVLKTVRKGLESDFVKLAEEHANANLDDSQRLWESIEGSLKDCQATCQATIDRLKKAIGNVRHEGKNFAEQAVRRIKLNLKDSEITALWTQIRTHTNALQMALQMVNLRATCLAGAATHELGPKIDELKAFMVLVHGNEVDLKTKALGIEPKYLTRLRKSAQMVISSATTERSISEPAPSLYGEVMDEEKRDRTMEWIPEPAIPEEPSGQRTGPHPSENYSGSQTTTSVDHVASNTGEAEPDSDGDFDFKMVMNTFARGTQQFDDGNFAEAQSTLQSGLEDAEELPLRGRQLVRVAAIKLMIATCIYHLGDLKEAETRLLAIAKERIHENETVEGAIRRCQASHLLAAVLFRQGRYSDAKRVCREARKGRARVLGKDHISYHETLSLLAQICEADGQHEYAKSVWEEIPKDVASQLVRIEFDFPDTAQGPSRSKSFDGDVPQARPPGDSTKYPQSSSDAQNATITDSIDKIPTRSLQSLSSTASSGTTPPSPEESTSPKLPDSLPHRQTLQPAFTRISASESSASTTAATSAAVAGSPVPPRPSLLRRIRRRKTSAPAILEEGNGGIQRRSTVPIGNANDSTEDAQGWLEYLMEVDKFENRRDESNRPSWPGLH